MLIALVALLSLAPPPTAVEAQASGRIRIEAHDPSVSATLRFDADEARRRRGAVVLDPRRGRRGLRGRAGGRLPATALGLPASCPGFFSEAAQHTIVLSADAPSMEIRVESSGPATLALVAPDGSVWCDASGTPSVHGYLVAGVYRVFVGSHTARRPPRYTLQIQEYGVAAPMPAPAPAIDPRTMPGSYTGRHPHWTDSVTLSADGTYVRGSGDGGRWWIEGTTLVLAWTSWGPERLELQRDGSFRASSNGFTLARGAVVVTPPPVIVTPPPVIVRPPVVVTPPVVVRPPVAAPSCRSTLLAMGHSASALIFCDDVRIEPYCADALLRAGHAPSALVFCADARIEPYCASALLGSGHAPSALVFCTEARTEPSCADALLRAGHAPSALIYCRDVVPTCATTLLRRGDSPSSLIHCSR